MALQADVSKQRGTKLLLWKKRHQYAGVGESEKT
jgi:hypothetical protein